mgnify:CR=1 FL=1
MAKVFDRVKELSDSTGTGAITLNGAVPGFQAFTSVLSEGDTTFYAISADNGAWETGLGTFSGGTLQRTTVFESSNGGSIVSLASGSKDVFIAYPASKSITKDTAVALSIALG